MLTTEKFVLDPILACELIIQLPQASGKDKLLAMSYLQKHRAFTPEHKASRYIMNLASKLAVAVDPSS
jgi:hypothetical protein